jgi:hypothetical protein
MCCGVSDVVCCDATTAVNSQDQQVETIEVERLEEALDRLLDGLG